MKKQLIFILLIAYLTAQQQNITTSDLNNKLYTSNWKYDNQPLLDFLYSDGKIELFFSQKSENYVEFIILIYNSQYIDNKVIQSTPIKFNLNSSIIESNDLVNWNEFEKTMRVNQNIIECDSHYIMNFSSIDQINLKMNSLDQSKCKFNIDVQLKLDTKDYVIQKIFAMMINILAGMLQYQGLKQLVKQQIQSPQETVKFSILTFGLIMGFDTYYAFDFTYKTLNQEIFDVMPCLIYMIVFLYEIRLIVGFWQPRYANRYETQEQAKKAVVVYTLQLYLGQFTIMSLLYFLSTGVEIFYVMSILVIPQIAHTAHIGQALKYEQLYNLALLTIPKTFKLCYMRGCPSNSYQMQPYYTFAIVFPSIILFTLLITYLQRFLGSRFFIPRCFLPKKFEYKRRLTIAGPGIGDKDFEICSICMMKLNENPDAAKYEEIGDIEKANKQQLINKKKRITMMVTPCNHQYHVTCLEQWIEVKLECPTCRQPLPPLDG